MALTQAQALDKFCLFFDYANTKLAGETKVDFLKRKQKAWALQIVERQIRDEKQAAADAAAEAVFAADLVGLDI